MITFLITGGTGSFGGACAARLLADHQDCQVRIFSRDEVKQAEMRVRFKDDPRLRFLLGCIRDEARLEEAMRGVDTVFHAAALKRVEACAYDPEEAIRTNVFGSMNVASAAKACGVARVVALSTDKACVDYHGAVVLGDGSRRSIAALVNSKAMVGVKSLSAGEVIERPITGWYKNRLGERGMVRVSYDTAVRGVGALVTEDHPVLTTGGWKAAGSLSAADLLITAEPAPNWGQQGAIVGWLLGDASLTRNERPALIFGHAADQLEWLKIKRAVMRGFNPGPIHTSARRDGRQAFSSFRVPSQGFCVGLRRAFYAQKKRIPTELVESYWSPQMLAAWYMDDGCLAGKQARFATHGFDGDDVAWVADLFTRHGMEAASYPVRVDGRDYSELRLTTKASYRLFEIIGRFVPTTMRHKVPKWCRSYEASAWEFGAPDRYVSHPVVVRLAREPKHHRGGGPLPPANVGKTHCHRGHPLSGANVRLTTLGGRQCIACVRMRKPGTGYRRSSVYCLGVEGTQNFIVGGVVLHNCAPSTTYGATKLCMEAVFTSSTANAERRPVFAVVRYGNVMGSRGGVLGIWRDAIAAGRPVPMTDPQATRFWFSVMGAVDLALWAAANARGGELIVPALPAFTLGDLAAAMGATSTFQIPWRSGEKAHEVMVSADECRDFRHRPKAFGATPMDLLIRYLPGEEEGPEYRGVSYSSRNATRLDVAALKERLA